MPSKAQDLIENAMSVIESWHGVVVKVTDGVNTSDAFVAVLKISPDESIDHKTGFPVQLSQRSYKFSESDLVLNSAEVQPRSGWHVIEYEYDSDDSVQDQATAFNDGTIAMTEHGRYEIHSPGSGKPAVELCSGGYRWLVRTSEVTIS